MKSFNHVHHGVDIQALMRALPISGLEPQCLAWIGGLIDVAADESWWEIIDFLEPPAGQRVPYMDPVKTIEKLLRRQGMASEYSQASAREVVLRMRKDVANSKWAHFFNSYESESPHSLSVQR